MDKIDELSSRLAIVRILVVDDEEDVRRDIEKSLRSVGYTVDVASNNIDAIEKLTKQHYHLALFDLGMPDFSSQFSDTAGVDLLRRVKQDFPGLSVIILTARGTLETAIECMKLGALDYFRKGFSSSDLSVRVQRALPEEVVAKLLEGIPINWNLNITLARDDILDKSEDVEILQRLFYDFREIKVSLIAKGASSARIFKITAQDKDETWRMPLVVKVGKKSQIQREVFNYETYVKDKLKRYPQLRNPAFTSNRGGVVMPFLNLVVDQLMTFRDYFYVSSEDDIVETLDKLFDESLGYWYRNTRKQEPVFIFQAYSEYLGTEKWDLQQATRRYLRNYVQADQVILPNSLGKFPNPVPLFNTLRKKYQGYSDDSAFISVVHGDLNVSNVLVDSTHNCWIIDFTRTGKAHILRDFVQFEAAIKYGLLDTIDIRERLDFEKTILSSEDPDALYGTSSNNQILRKAAKAVFATRLNAKRVIGGQDLYPSYLIGLLFYNMDMLRYFEDAITAESKLCILYATDQILGRLKEMGLD